MNLARWLWSSINNSNHGAAKYSISCCISQMRCSKRINCSSKFTQKIGMCIRSSTKYWGKNQCLPSNSLSKRNSPATLIVSVPQWSWSNASKSLCTVFVSIQRQARTTSRSTIWMMVLLASLICRLIRCSSLLCRRIIALSLRLTTPTLLSVRASLHEKLLACQSLLLMILSMWAIQNACQDIQELSFY